MKKIITLITFLISTLAIPAATIPSDGTSGDLRTKANAAMPGDTVVIAPGIFTWSSGASLNLRSNVTIQGAGTATTGGEDRTIIQDAVGTGGTFLTLNVASGGANRLSGITFRSAGGGIKDGGTVIVNGPGKIRIDHCHFDFSSQNNYKVLNLNGGVFGVADHNIFDLRETGTIFAYNGRKGSLDPHNMGNYEWTQPTQFGSDNYFYIEDNIANGSTGGGTYNSRLFDGFTAAKIVARFNTLSAVVMGETHATGHSPDDRGLRSQEIYGNRATSPLAKDPNFCMVDIGSGTALIWGNSANNVYKNMFIIKLTRINNSTYSQSPTPQGWGYCGTQFNGRGSMWDGGTALGNDTVLGYPGLDQPGRGSGDLLVGILPSKINQTTGNIFWPHQPLEPIYVWNNAGNIAPGWGGNYYANSTGGRVVANRDYYPAVSGIQMSPTSPFNGSSGTGWGTLANRPTTCSPGVAYFAIDQGSWNTSSSNPYGVQQNGADGVLYKCTTQNTWTLYYTPYTYPHPLQGLSPIPPPPTNNQLRITFQMEQSTGLTNFVTLPGATITITNAYDPLIPGYNYRTLINTTPIP